MDRIGAELRDFYVIDIFICLHQFSLFSTSIYFPSDTFTFTGFWELESTNSRQRGRQLSNRSKRIQI